MTDFTRATKYLRDDRGSVAVDWTVISAAAVGLAVATTAIMTDAIDVVSSRMDSELRSRMLTDEFIQFAANHFEPILATGTVSEEHVETIYNAAGDLMNHELLSELTHGIEALEAGTLTEEGLVGLVALGSVAYQRNLVDDATLDYYFGFEGSEAYYLTANIVS